MKRDLRIRLIMSFIFALLLALQLAACRKSHRADAEHGTSARASSGVVDEFGVESCDAWKVKYAKCIDEKAPAASRERMRSAFQRMTVGWKQLASTPSGQKALQEACKQAMDSTRQAILSMGCSL
jgi:hypothetical protein